MIHGNHYFVCFNQGRPRITWYEVSPSLTCIRVLALMGPTLKSKDTCPRVHCCNDPILATLSGSQMILSRGMPKASNVRRGRMLVKALVSTKALLIWEAPKKVVTYKGLSLSISRLAKSLEENVTDSLVSCIVINTVPFQPERLENFVPVLKPIQITLLFHLGPNFGSFRPVPTISTCFGEFWPINTFRQLLNLLINAEKFCLFKF